jgi:hypothetical protein
LLGSAALLIVNSTAPPSSLKGPATDALLLLLPARPAPALLLLLPAGQTPSTLSGLSTQMLSGNCNEKQGMTGDVSSAVQLLSGCCVWWWWSGVV